MTIKYHDYTYHKLLQHILDYGVNKDDRTGTGTLSSFAYQMRFDLSNNSIPLVTTKKMFYKGIIKELLWFLSGSTNSHDLEKEGVNIWKEWANLKGELGPIYGSAWRAWPTHDNNHIDQIADVIEQLRTNPNDRRIIISAWNPEFLPDNIMSFDDNIKNGKCALPPCHCFIQFWTDGNGNLSCHLYQRSCDVFLGGPFNIAQYSILVHMIAQVTGLLANEFIWTGGDVHIYKNLITQCKEQLTREPYSSPAIQLNQEITEIDDFKFEDFEITKYKHHPAITGQVSV